MSTFGPITRPRPSRPGGWRGKMDGLPDASEVEVEPLVEIRESVQVNAPTERVWSLVTDVRRHPEFAGPKSITKQIEFDGPLQVGSRWVAHEKVGPRRFDAPSDVTAVEPPRQFSWVSFPPAKEANRGEGGRVFWSYELRPSGAGCELVHSMRVLPPARGALPLKIMYKVANLPKKQRDGIRQTLANIKAAAEGTPG